MDQQRSITRPDGRVAYSDEGAGPLVIAVPGMGDLRSTWDPLASILVGAGYRVVATDLRGHGGSDTSFDEYGDEPTASDIVALIEALDAGPAVVIGNSMGGSAAVLVAAERPELVSKLVLVDGLLREPQLPIPRWLLLGLYRTLFAAPWGARVWAAYYASLMRGRRPASLAEHQNAVREALRRPGYLRAFRELALQLRHDVVEAALPRVRTPVLALFGELDPDMGDVHAAEAFARKSLGATTAIIARTGHYPHLQAPDEVGRAVLAFLATPPEATARA